MPRPMASMSTPSKTRLGKPKDTDHIDAARSAATAIESIPAEMSSSTTLTITSEQIGLTLGALLRSLLPGNSWSEVRRIVETRRVRVNGDLCLDPARRLKEGESVELLGRPLPAPRHEENIRIRHLDEHIVVV